MTEVQKLSGTYHQGPITKSISIPFCHAIYQKAAK